MTIADLANQLGPVFIGAEYREGTVAVASPLTVYLGASAVAVPAKRLASYTPVAAHVVACLRQGTSIIVLGQQL